MEPVFNRSGTTLYQGDCRDVLACLPESSVQTCVTSPPYWGLRDYGIDPSVWGGDFDCEHEWGDTVRHAKANGVCGPNGRMKNAGYTDSRVGLKEAGKFCQRCGAWAGNLGLEPTPELFVEHMIELFAAVWRVLKDDGTLWLNLGDCYATGAGKVGNCPGGGEQGERWKGNRGERTADNSGKAAYRFERVGPMTQPNRMPIDGLKSKDLVGIPWRVALALQSAGWYLRSDIIEEVEFYCPCGCGHVMEERIWRWSQDRDLIWHKPNPMPESVSDRPTKSHEYIFLLSKNQKYYYDAQSIRELQSEGTHERFGKNPAPSTRRKFAKAGSGIKNNGSFDAAMTTMIQPDGKRNKRSVWTIPTQAVSDAHFATFPEKLIEPCILAGCPEGGTVLDPFSGSGTTAKVCKALGRKFVGAEMNPNYLEIARKRIGDQENLF